MCVAQSSYVSHSVINIQQASWKGANDAVILDDPILERNQFKLFAHGIALHIQENLLPNIGIWLALLKSLFGQVEALTPPHCTLLYCVCVRAHVWEGISTQLPTLYLVT